MPQIITFLLTTRECKKVSTLLHWGIGQTNTLRDVAYVMAERYEKE